MKKPFFGFSRPRVGYPVLTDIVFPPKDIPLPGRVTFLIEIGQSSIDRSALKPGDIVQTGEKIRLSEPAAAYAVSSVTGKIVDISPVEGEFGRRYAALSIDTVSPEVFDETFAGRIDGPTLQTALDFLLCCPGAPPWSLFSISGGPIHTLVVLAQDPEWMVATNHYVAVNRFEAMRTGVDMIRKITGVERIIVVTARDGIQSFGAIDAEIRAVDTAYPSAFPLSITRGLLGIRVDAGTAPEAYGIAFFSAEAVAAVGEAFVTGRLPVKKIVTVIRKDGRRCLVETRIGTPIRDLIMACEETLSDGDRLIVGGPLTGRALYTDLHPVTADTDAVMVQGRAEISPLSDYPCINCGECIRACPAHVPVSMLVRFLEAGAYQTAADEYDLFSCIECGLCSFVCVARIPVFQYIRLAKHELTRSRKLELDHA